jgi:hypothetical protein
LQLELGNPHCGKLLGLALCRAAKIISHEIAEEDDNALGTHDEYIKRDLRYWQREQHTGIAIFKFSSGLAGEIMPKNASLQYTLQCLARPMYWFDSMFAMHHAWSISLICADNADSFIACVLARISTFAFATASSFSSFYCLHDFCRQHIYSKSGSCC